MASLPCLLLLTLHIIGSILYGHAPCGFGAQYLYQLMFLGVADSRCGFILRRLLNELNGNPNVKYTIVVWFREVTAVYFWGHSCLCL